MIASRRYEEHNSRNRCARRIWIGVMGPMCPITALHSGACTAVTAATHTAPSVVGKKRAPLGLVAPADDSPRRVWRHCDWQPSTRGQPFWTCVSSHTVHASHSHLDKRFRKKCKSLRPSSLTQPFETHPPARPSPFGDSPLCDPNLTQLRLTA